MANYGDKGLTAEQTAKWLKPTQGFVGSAIFSYGMDRFLVSQGWAEDKGHMSSVRKALVHAFLWQSFTPVMTTIQFSKFGAAIAGASLANYRYADARNRVYHSKSGRFLGGGHYDTQQAYTMRQAGIQAMNQTGMQARQVFGNEASLMHR
ncbi:MAG TPA: hypothetical protein VFD33_02940 [Bacillota bacterium]|nr:hypothetical protein [Bacillota bacterium]